MSQITNLRYSITLNDAQLDYLSDGHPDEGFEALHPEDILLLV